MQATSRCIALMTFIGVVVVATAAVPQGPSDKEATPKASKANRAVKAAEKPATEPRRQKSPHAWTFKQAMKQLELDPHDAYLQYVVLQLARREGKLQEAVTALDSFLTHGPADFQAHRESVDLFSIFTGALAVQESLQLGAMRGGLPRKSELETQPNDDANKTEPVATLPTIPEGLPAPQESPEPPHCYPSAEPKFHLARATKLKSNKGKPLPLEELPAPKEIPAASETLIDPKEPVPTAPAADPNGTPKPSKLEAAKRKKELVAIADLESPKIKSHPWKKMLGEQKPEISTLSRCVPTDFYLAEFRSLAKMLEAMEASDLWVTHLLNQATREARTQRVGERVQRQLGLETSKVLRPFYDLVVEEVAVVGSDHFLGEGSDISLLFKIKRPDLFKTRVDAFLSHAEKSRPDAIRSTGTYRGISFVHLATAERDIDVYAAYPEPGLHVRSNSRVAFERILDAIQGKDGEGKAVNRLGDTAEFAYIRTMMPRGAEEEDGLIYLPSRFLRHMVSANLRLTEQHRKLSYNHLRMIGHAALLYRTEFGKAPESLEALVKAQCLPKEFGTDVLTCPDGGRYALSNDGTCGVCSKHGQAHFLTPCCEIPVKEVNGLEADAYKTFVENSGADLDAIALRIRVRPDGYRLETVVLPRIDDVYCKEMLLAFGGQPKPLDALPVPKGNIFSMVFSFDKDNLLEDESPITTKIALLAFAPLTPFPADMPWGALANNDSNPLMGSLTQAASAYLELAGLSEKTIASSIPRHFWDRCNKGFGNQIGFHVYDAPPSADLSLPKMFGDMLGSTGNSSYDGKGLMFGVMMFLASSFHAPAYLAIPLRDEKIVDDLLVELDPLFAQLARKSRVSSVYGVDFGTDFYKIHKGHGQIFRGNSVIVGPVRWHFFSARIGKGFYLASKLFILEDILEAEQAQKDAPKDKKADLGPAAHAMVRLRPSNWNKTLPDYSLGWAENNRRACLNNLGPLSSVGRSYSSLGFQNPAVEKLSPREHGTAAVALADQLHTVHFFCPDGGEYLLSPNGNSMTCSLHGSSRYPKQQKIPAEKSPLSKMMREFHGATLSLTFMKEGLRAVVNIEKKPELADE